MCITSYALRLTPSTDCCGRQGDATSRRSGTGHGKEKGREGPQTPPLSKVRNSACSVWEMRAVIQHALTSHRSTRSVCRQEWHIYIYIPYSTLNNVILLHVRRCCEGSANITVTPPCGLLITYPSRRLAPVLPSSVGGGRMREK